MNKNGTVACDLLEVLASHSPSVTVMIPQCQSDPCQTSQNPPQDFSGEDVSCCKLFGKYSGNIC